VGYGGRIRDEYRLHLEALEIHRETGFVRMQAAEAGNLAVLYATEGETLEAEHWMHDALAMFREVGDRQAEILSLGNIGSLNTELGRDSEAERAIKRARLAAGELGMTHLEQALDTNLALLRLMQGNPALADELLLRVEASQANTSPNIYDIGHRCLYRGIARLLLGDPASAWGLMQEARALYEKALMPRDLGLSLALGSAAAAALDVEAEALAWLEQARSIAEDLDDDDILRVVTMGEGHIELLRARQARAAGETEDASLLEQLVAARLDMVSLNSVHPSLVRLARRLLERASAETEVD
jgi:tetratricopeptide (TPR) repeat protein